METNISDKLFFKNLRENNTHKNVKIFYGSNILRPYQYGFLPNRSTHEAIFDATRHICPGINNRKLTGLLFLDVAKTFNCVSHKRLYRKLELVGFSMRCINWFRSYLSRSQHVLIKNTISCDINVDAGIAQGMVLGPLIFIFYINDIISLLSRLR